MKNKRMEITEFSKRIWLFSANKIKSSEYFSKQPTQLIAELIIAAHNCHNGLKHEAESSGILEQFCWNSNLEKQVASPIFAIIFFFKSVCTNI